MRIRRLSPTAAEEIEWVARKMRQTLAEVVDNQDGASLYSIQWLRNRVNEHLAPSFGAVFVAQDDATGLLQGHVIAREDVEEDLGEVGLMSTIFVEPEVRREGLGRKLVETALAWMKERGATLAVTKTAASNSGLIKLLESLGFSIDLQVDSMVRLSRPIGDEKSS